MSTDIRAELSKSSKYYISKHRYYELKHYCLQYPEWKRRYREALLLSGIDISDKVVNQIEFMDPVKKVTERTEQLLSDIYLVEDTARDTDVNLWRYILVAVTEGLSFDKLKARLEIPCGREMFYDRYRKFFWLLDQKHHAGD